MTVEDFESGDFLSYDWEFGGDSDWTITSSNPYEGTYSAKSGSIGSNSESELILSMDVATDGQILFYYKVSCEDDPSSTDYDYLAFFIDGQEQGKWDGEVDWTEAVYDVTAGQHTFKWTYEKDGNSIGGQDCAWIDWIELPIAEQGVGIGEDRINILDNQLGSYPNPFTNQTRIAFNVSESSMAQLKITDLMGRTIWSKELNAETGEQVVVWNGKDKDGNTIETGIYIVELFLNNELRSVHKLLKSK